MPERFLPVHWWQLIREIEPARSANEIRLRSVGWEHRPHLVLLTLEPVDEQHLHRTTTIPVALLVVGLDASHARTESLRVDGGKTLGRLCGNAHLPFCSRGTAHQTDLPVRPRLRRYPLDLIHAVRQRRSQDVVVALGEEVPALVRHHVGVATLHRFELSAHVSRCAKLDVPVVHVVWGTTEDRRRLGHVLWPVNVELHLLAVTHRYHQLAIDDRDGFERLLERIAMRDQYGVTRRAALRG